MGDDTAAPPASDAANSSFRFIVTGFGPFQGVNDNPTTFLCEKLVDSLKQTEETACGDDDGDYPILSPWTKTIVMETSVESVQTTLNEIHQELLTASSSSDKNNKTIILHLGVDASTTKFRLETCAYNDASFRVPDEQGYQPWQESILGTSRPVGETLTTRLDIPSLVTNLNHHAATTMTTDNTTAGAAALAESSMDPGRFVCNYTYCYSMDKFQCCSSTLPSSKNDCTAPSSSSSTADRVRCLFLHVPLFKIISEEDQLAFVVKLMAALHRQFIS